MPPGQGRPDRFTAFAQPPGHTHLSLIGSTRPHPISDPSQQVQANTNEQGCHQHGWEKEG